MQFDGLSSHGTAEGESVRVVLGELASSELREECEPIAVENGATVTFTGEGIYQTEPPDSCDIRGTTAEVPDFASEQVSSCDVLGELAIACRPRSDQNIGLRMAFGPKVGPQDDNVTGEFSLIWVPDDGSPACRQTYDAVLERLPR
jgi:hypothetical protein